MNGGEGSASFQYNSGLAKTDLNFYHKRKNKNVTGGKHSASKDESTNRLT
jgi:hypothetical protein